MTVAITWNRKICDCEELLFVSDRPVPTEEYESEESTKLA